jgi:hypothetical protein
MLSGDGVAGRSGERPCKPACSLIKRQPAENVKAKRATMREAIRISIRTRRRKRHRRAATQHDSVEEEEGRAA